MNPVSLTLPPVPAHDIGLPPRGRRLLRTLTAFAAVAVVAASGFLAATPCAAKPDVLVVSSAPGVTPFISLVQLTMDDASLLDHVQFTIAPKPGSVTRAIAARYSSAYLTRRGYLNTATGAITVPIFGLYQDYANSVTLVCTLTNGVSQTNQLLLTSAKYEGGVDNGGEYDHPAVVKLARTSDTTLSYDFMELKSFINPHSPSIVDTDGELRWVGTSNTASMEAIFIDNSFFVVSNVGGGPTQPQGGVGTTILRNEFDGSVSTVADFASAGVTNFHHNFDFGKSGILTPTSTAQYLDSTVMEIDTAGNILHSWDLAAIITAAMVAGGDDPTKFVAAAGSMVDWFHNNANTYRPSDDSLIVSSRENFVIALDYETGAIKWILGDPTKQWYQFPSLAKYALMPLDGAHYPIGQHAVSIYRDKLLLFDDGYYSLNHTPKGKNRTYSAPRKYSINETAGTFKEVWDYLADPPLYSPITSSVYEDQRGDYLIDYAVVGPYKFSELIGLNPAGAKVFDYKYTEVNEAGTAWNAMPVHLENLVFN